jgi:hypothetical protein
MAVDDARAAVGGTGVEAEVDGAEAGGGVVEAEVPDGAGAVSRAAGAAAVAVARAEVGDLTDRQTSDDHETQRTHHQAG